MIKSEIILKERKCHVRICKVLLPTYNKNLTPLPNKYLLIPIEHLAEFPVIESYANQGWWVIYMMVGVGIPISVCFFKDVFRGEKNVISY